MDRFAGNTSGASAIEYALIAAVVSIVIFAAALSIGGTLNTKFYGPLLSGFN